MTLTDVNQDLRFLLQPHLPLLRLVLRFMLLSAVCCLVLVAYCSSAGLQHAPVPWNPFRRPPGDGRGGHEGRRSEGRKERREAGDLEEILNTDPNYPKIRDWLYDHTYYSYYDGTVVYSNQDSINGAVSRKPHQAEIEMFSKVLDRAVTYLDVKHPQRYTREHCNSLRYRTVPTAGLEADVTCRRAGQMDRVSLLLPFKSAQVIYHHDLHSSPRSIVLIMPLQGRIENLQLFIENVKKVLENGDIELGLCVVYFEDAHTSHAREVIAAAENAIPKLRTEFLLLERDVGEEKNSVFSRGRGLQVGADKTKLGGDVLFFCDVDVLFTREFLTRCQATPVKGYQVYMPVVFSLYNPQFLYPLHKHKVPPPLEQLKVVDDHGYWRLWGHGMVCLHKSDFREVKGFDQTRQGWGGEDLKFLKQVVRHGRYKVIRSLDPGLFHLYHTKDCTDAHTRYACLKMQAMNEASRTVLGLWYFKNKSPNLSVFGVLAEGNQPHEHHDGHDYDQGQRGGEREAEVMERKIMTSLWLPEALMALVLVVFACVDFGLMVYSYRREAEVERRR